MVDMRRVVVAAVATVVAAVAAACGGGPGPAPVDPVTAAAGQLEALLEPSPLDRCSAAAVLNERENRVTRLARSADRAMPGGSSLNLSQASALASDAHLMAQASAATARGPGNASQLRKVAQIGEQAARSFDEIVDALEVQDRSGANPGSLAGAAAADRAYARVWFSYFDQRAAGVPADNVRLTSLLDWLTSRSLADPRILDDYAADFMDAREHGCDGANAG